MRDRTDPSWPGICFPGGHVEPGESFVESAIREVQEETGLTILDPILCGIKQFPLQGEDAMSCCCFGPVATGTLTSSAEGEVFWLPREELENCRLAPDFSEMLRVFESPGLSEFYYYREPETGEWQHRLL